MASKSTRITQLKAAFAVVVLVLIVIIALQNTEAVDTTVLFGSFSMPLAALLALALAFGALGGAVLVRRLARPEREA